MSPVACIDPREVAAVAALSPDDPIARHARECPRCSALLDAWRAFDAADRGDVPDADLADADTRLSRALAGAIGSTVPPASSPARRRVGDDESSFWQRLFHPAMRPAVALALVAAVIAVVLFAPQLVPHGSNLRGVSRPGAPALTLGDATLTADSLAVAWSPVAEAESYEIRFYSGSLAELGHVGPIAGDHRTLGRAQLGFPLVRGDTVMVRVVGLAGGDVIARSPTRVLVVR